MVLTTLRAIAIALLSLVTACATPGEQIVVDSGKKIGSTLVYEVDITVDSRVLLTEEQKRAIIRAADEAFTRTLAQAGITAKKYTPGALADTPKVMVLVQLRKAVCVPVGTFPWYVKDGVTVKADVALWQGSEVTYKVTQSAPPCEGDVVYLTTNLAKAVARRVE